MTTTASVEPTDVEISPITVLEPLPSPFTNEFISLHSDKVRFPDGREGTYTKIKVGSGFGAVVIPVTRWRGEVYVGLVRQYRYAIEGFTLEFPRGGTDSEDFSEAARELVEETGLVADSGRYLGFIRPDSGILTQKINIWATFHKTNPSITPDHVEAETGLNWRWFSVGEFMGLIDNGGFTDGVSLAAYAKAMTSNVLDADI